MTRAPRRWTWMPQERERGITITAAATSAYWREHRVNIIDTPGHVDFTAEVERSLRVLDGGVVVLDAVAGVQSQSETVWRQADKYHVPRICFVNKMDRVGASYERALESIRRRLGGNAVAVQLPIGAEAEFQGVADLLTGNAAIYVNGNGNGKTAGAPQMSEVPEEYKEAFEQYRQTMIEKIVETDEKLLIRYLEGEQIEEESLRNALRQATISRGRGAGAVRQRAVGQGGPSSARRYRGLLALAEGHTGGGRRGTAQWEHRTAFRR